MTDAQATPPLWIDESGPPAPLGIRCRDCRALAFPAARACIVCGSTAVEEVPLARRGRIISFTQNGARIVAEIRLEDGPPVMGWLDAGQPVAIGMPVRFAPQPNELRFERDE